MIDERYKSGIAIVCLSLAVILIFLAAFITPGTDTTAAAVSNIEKVLDKNSITEINIDMKEADWKWILENATKEEYRSADITINGETYYNVGVRAKGNSSLTSVASDPETDRFSFKIDFGQYMEGQTYHGYEKLALNNMMSDATYMKEYLSYDLYESLGIPTPEYSYSNIKVNGKAWGLYLAVEAIEGNFIQKKYGSLEGNLYKPESMEMGGGMPFGGSAGGGENLKYTDDKPSSYSVIRDGAVFNTTTDHEFQKVIEMIKQLDAGTNLEQYLDVEEILKYFAVNTFLVNLDSYSGGMYHNYYLYEKDGKFSIIPWDLNMSFGGFTMNMGAGQNGVQKVINFPIDVPVTGNIEDAPLIGNLLKVDKYKELYHGYLDKIINEYVKSGALESSVYKLDRLIDGYVKSDATAFYTYDEYKAAIPELISFSKDRALSVASQLAGEQPSTTYGNIETKVDLSKLGTMTMGGREMPAGGQMPDMGAMPPQENMMEIFSIIRGADINNLTAEQKEKLKALGVDDNMLNMMKGMGPGGMPPMVNAMPGASGTMSTNPINLVLQIAAMVVLLSVGLLFIFLFKRKKLKA